MHRTHASLLALLVLLPAAAQADEAGEKLVRDYIAALDASPGWASSAKTIRSEGGKVIVEDWNASLKSGTFKQSSATVTLEGLSARDGGGFLARNWSVNGMKFGSASTVVSIPSLSASDLAAPLLPAIAADPAKPFSSLAVYYRLAAGLDFGRIDIPAMTMSQTIEAPGADGKPMTVRTAGTYNGLALDNAVDGRIAKAAIAKMTTATESPAPPTGSWNLIYEGVEALNSDLAAMADVFDPGAYKDGKGDGQWREAMKSFTVAKIAATIDGRNVFSTGALVFRGFRMRQTERPFAEIMDRLMSSPPPDEAKAIDLLTRDMPSLVGFYGFDSLSIADMKGGDPAVAEFKLDNFAMTGFSGDGLDRIALEGLSGGGPEFGGTMMLFAIDGIEWPRLSALTSYAKFIAIQSGGHTPDAEQAAEFADSLFNIYPKYARIVIEGLSGGPPGREPVRMGRYTANITGHIGSSPVSGDAEIDSIVVPGWLLRFDPSSAQVFDALGYAELEFGLKGASVHDANTGNATSHTRIDAKAAGTLSFDIAFGGITEANIRSAFVPFLTAAGGGLEMPQMIAALSPFSFDGFALRFEDASLTKRVLAFAAKMQGMDEQTLIGNTAAMLQLGLSQLKHPAFTEQMVTAVKTFFAAPKSITLEAKPPTPVKAAQFVTIDPQNPGAAIDLLGVSVRAND